MQSSWNEELVGSPIAHSHWLCLWSVLKSGRPEAFFPTSTFDSQPFLLLWSECLCCPQIPYVKTLIPKAAILVSVAFERCLSHEGGTLTNGLVPCERLQRLPSPLLPVRASREACSAEETLTWPCWNQDPGLTRLQHCEKGMFISCSVWGSVVFCYSSLNGLRYRPTDARDQQSDWGKKSSLFLKNCFLVLVP